MSRTRRTGIPPRDEEVEAVLNLSTKDIAILWTPILYTCDSAHWDPLQWGPDSNVDASLFQRMKMTSYRLIALFLKASTASTTFNRNLETDAQLLMLFNTSDSNASTTWPTLPEMPSKSAVWETLRPSYVPHTEHRDYRAFETKMCTLDNIVPPAIDTPQES